jgi:hypothetical protein
MDTLCQIDKASFFDQFTKIIINCYQEQNCKQYFNFEYLYERYENDFLRIINLIEKSSYDEQMIEHFNKATCTGCELCIFIGEFRLRVVSCCVFINAITQAFEKYFFDLISKKIHKDIIVNFSHYIKYAQLFDCNNKVLPSLHTMNERELFDNLIKYIYLDSEINCLLLDKMCEDIEPMFSKLISWMRQLKKEDLPKKRSMINFIKYVVIDLIDLIYVSNELKEYLTLTTDLYKCIHHKLLDFWVFHTLSKELSTCFTYELTCTNKFLTISPTEIFYYNHLTCKQTYLTLNN